MLKHTGRDNLISSERHKAMEIVLAKISSDSVPFFIFIFGILKNNRNQRIFVGFKNQRRLLLETPNRETSSGSYDNYIESFSMEKP